MVLAWGRGIGKTWFIIWASMMLVAEHIGKPRGPMMGVRIVYLMPATTQARKTVLHRFEAMLGGEFRFLGGRWNGQELRASFPDGSWIQFVSQEQRELIRGIRCDVVLIDECDDIDISVFDGTVMPWLSEPFSLERVMMGGTPRRGRAGLLYRSHTNGLQRVGGFHSVKATWRDAPEHVKRSLVESELDRLTRSGQLAVFKREWECDFDAGEGLVYPHLERDFHVCEPARNTVWTEVLVGVDHGYEDPGVFVLVGVIGHGRDAVAHVLWECHERHREESWWVAKALEVRSWYPQAKWYCDPSMPSRVTAFRSAGCDVREVDNSILDGVSAVAEMFATKQLEDGTRYARLYVAPRCENVISELGLYRYKRDAKNPDAFRDEIEDRNNHTMDALRYAIFNRFGGPDMGRNHGSLDRRQN